MNSRDAAAKKVVPEASGEPAPLTRRAGLFEGDAPVRLALDFL